MKLLFVLLLSFPILTIADWGQPECNIKYDKNQAPIAFTNIYPFDDFDESVYTPEGISKFNPQHKLDFKEYAKNDFFETVVGTILEIVYGDDKLTVVGLVVSNMVGQRFYLNMPRVEEMRCIHWQNEQVPRILELWKHFSPVVIFTNRTDGASGKHLTIISAELN
jgi:hypothetical protein